MSEAPGRVPIRDGLLTGSLSRLEDVRLSGSKCAHCGETSLGRNSVCPNCSSEHVQEIALGNRGKLWSYTVVRHKPPGNYKGPDPFVPFGLGLVELPEGLRVMSPIDGDVDKLKIGTELEFRPYVRSDADGREVVAFAFEALNSGGARV